MITINVFSTKYNGVFHPFGIESLYHLAVYIREKNIDIELDDLNTLTLEVFQYLINNNIIYVLENNWMKNKELNKIKLSNNDLIKNIKEKMSSSKSMDEFYDFYWIKYQNWYREGLENKGLNVYTIKWNEFINERIGDLEKWIEENKPK
jgi:hypothetical protein